MNATSCIKEFEYGKTIVALGCDSSGLTSSDIGLISGISLKINTHLTAFSRKRDVVCSAIIFQSFDPMGSGIILGSNRGARA
jgi:hypothetical protein